MGAGRWQVGRTILRFAPQAEIERGVGFYAGDVLCPIGSFSFVNSALSRGHYGLTIRIGRHCSIGGGMSVAAPRHPVEFVTTGLFSYDRRHALTKAMLGGAEATRPVRRFVQKPPPVIGHDVWLGTGVTLNPGVRIGHGAVIAAMSVVTKDVPDYAVVGGNPARLIRPRFDQGIVRDLLALAWWDHDPAALLRFDLGDPAAFIRDFARERDSVPRHQPRPLRLADAVRAL